MEDKRRSWRQRLGGKSARKNPKTCYLWDREFALVKEGLAQDQVASFVNELMERYQALLKQQQESAGLRSLTSQAVLEAQREAASLLAEAKREGELEAARLLAEARQQAQMEVAEGKRRSLEAAEKEAADILLSAKKKAQLIEQGAWERARLFLLQAREDIGNQVVGDAKEAYYRLVSDLQGLIALAQGLEDDWKRKEVELWEHPALSWEGSPDGHGDSLPVGEALDTPAGSVSAEVSVAPGTAGPSIQRTENEASPAPTPERPEAPGAEVLPERRALSVEQYTPSFADNGASRRAEGRLLLKEEAPANGGSERDGEKGEAFLQEKGAKPVPTAPPLASTLYSGEVEVVLAPAVDVAKVSQVYHHLQVLPELKVLSTSGSWEGGTTLAVKIDRPFPLLSHLLSLPWVEISSKPEEKGRSISSLHSSLGGKGERAERIWLTLKDQETEGQGCPR